MRILVIEDDAVLCQTLQRQFIEAGFNVDVAADGEEGLFAALEHPLDAAIVDLGLPRMSGIDVIRELRAKQRAVPVLVLTGRAGWQGTVEALEAGADEYVRKPVQFEELLARVHTLMRRNGGWSTSELVCGPIALHTATQIVRVHGAQVNLTTFEFRVLQHLMLYAGNVVSKTELKERLYYGDFEPEGNVIDVLVARLRRKLDPDGSLDPIQTVRGSGYRFRLPRGAA
jgi:two-component system response regulator PhoP